MTNRSRNIVFLLFALSGFSGLIYESLWTHYLKLFLGHAAYAQTLVLCLFMAGLAGGSWLASVLSRRWKDLFLAYALTEAVIGLCALFFHRSFDRAIAYSYGTVIPALGSPAAVSLYQWSLSALLILPQAVLLGMTFPLLTSALLRAEPDRSGRSIALLYFTNSLGAAAGVLASGFLLIRIAGLPGTMRTAGLVNLIVAGSVWLLASRLPGHARRAPVVAPSAGSGAGGRWFGILLAVSLLTGAASFIYEIGWIRMLSLVLGSSTHAFELMLSVFISGLAFGGFWVRGRIDRAGDAVRMLIAVQIVMGALALLTLPLYGGSFAVMQGLVRALPQTDAGYFLFTLGSGAIAFVIMFPASFCAGMTLPLITAALVRKGFGERSVGAVYAANTAGAILGVLFAVHVAMPMTGLKGLLIAGASVDIAAGLGLAWAGGPAVRSVRMRVLLTAFGAVVVAASALFSHLDAYKMSSGVYRYGTLDSPRKARLLFYRDGKTASVSAVLLGSRLSVRTNGKADAAIELNRRLPPTVDEPTMVLLAALPLAVNPGARTVANIGFGSGLTTTMLLDAPSVAEVDTVEIEPAMIEAAKNFGPYVEPALRDPRSRVFVDDAKTFFSASRRSYDIIVSEPSNPWVSGVADLFSEEFYRAVGRHLNRGGVFCQWLQLYEIDDELAASVLKALGAAFDDYAVYATADDDVVILARNGGTLATPGPAIFENPRLRSALARVGIGNLQDIALRRAGGKRLFAELLETYTVRPNSDYYPVLDQNAERTRFLQDEATALTSFSSSPLPVADMLSRRAPEGTRTSADLSALWSRSVDVYTAMALRDYVLSGRFPPERGRPPASVRHRAERLRQLFFSDCTAGDGERLDAIYETLGVRMTPDLRPAELRAVWKRLERGACVRSFTARERKWMDLVEAVGRRDAAAMASAAGTLLDAYPAMPVAPKSYAVAAGMLGNLAEGREARSLALWKEYGGRIYGADRPSVLFRFLTAASCRP